MSKKKRQGKFEIKIAYDSAMDIVVRRVVYDLVNAGAVRLIGTGSGPAWGYSIDLGPFETKADARTFGFKLKKRLGEATASQVKIVIRENRRTSSSPFESLKE